MFKPKGIIVHSMSEYIEYNNDIYRARDFLEEIGLSVHALITPEGYVESMVKTDKKALHAGQSEWKEYKDLNDYFLGFELLVQGNNSYTEFLNKIDKPSTYTEHQIETSIMVTKIWMETYNISPEYVVRHSDVSGNNVRTDPKRDPGDGFPWKEFKEKL